MKTIKPYFRGLSLVVIVNVVMGGMLSFYGVIGAAPQTGRQPFSNPAEQRNEMIRELRNIQALLEEQNKLLRNIATDIAHEKPPR